MNLALGERLAASHRIILIDRPGFGFSARKAGDGSSPADQASVLRDVLDKLGIDARHHCRPLLGWHHGAHLRTRFSRSASRGSS